tara:strand:- start:1291 stop:2031 length:741 start_codon:yes stop_codon:yes gene_type:complete
MGLGEAVADKKILENATNDLELISGQKVVITKARKSIAGFKIREGWPIGCKVTLRGERMYEFLERLVGIAIPRIRDFRGLSPKSFDGQGNFAMGVNEQIIFPEIDYDKIDTLRGLDITITTTARNDDEGRALLKALRFPFRVISTTIDEKTDPNHEAPVEEAPAEEEIAEETLAEIVAEAGTAELESEEAPAAREVSEESSAEAAEAEKVPAAEETAEETLIQAEERESVDLQPEEASADENQEES